ncbi:MAG: mannose-6-phosphate isomerase, class I [Micrococcales bacterium]|nr:mannose-6-phosphate isomerase, class I [Micrococcales bacterium]
MIRISPAVQSYPWGSVSALQAILGLDVEGPLAEAWFGAHALAPALLRDGRGLDAVIADDPEHALGADVVDRFGAQLPYLLKVIAVARPLSLQVHPQLARAQAGFEEEELAGVPRDAQRRSYKDRNHKPELVFALTPLEAVCGFRAPRRAAELFAGLETPLARGIHEVLRSNPGSRGIETVFTRLMTTGLQPGPEEIAELAQACRARLSSESSPSPRGDATVVRLHEEYPGDPGVVSSLLLNPVSLRPGEALFVPAGGLHAYLSGVGVEIMANSDNVLRAGLTSKHVDVAEVLRNVDYVAAPPIRIAPETYRTSTLVFYAPVDDFELSVTTLDGTDDVGCELPGSGPRVLLCLEGEVTVVQGDDELVMTRGEAVFAAAGGGSVSVHGHGRLVQADVP